jgi:hypothetical protein
MVVFFMPKRQHRRKKHRAIVIAQVALKGVLYMNKFNFNLQLFADEDSVSLDTLKEQGFSDEDLQEFTPKTEPVVDPVIEPVIEPVEEETPQDSVIVEEEIPHADNLKMALKEERERRKVLSAELAALKAQQPITTIQQTAPIVPPTQQTSVEDQIASIADEKVKKALGITEDIDTLQYSDPALYLKYVKGVAKEEFKLETQYEQQQTVYNQNRTFVSELQQQADFPVLYQFAVAELDELPGKKARVIEQAFSRIDQGNGSKEDIETMRSFVSECRTKMTGITQSPVTPVIAPTTSPLDKANGLPRAQSLSGSKTSAMSWAQVEDLIRQGKVDQIPKEMISQIDKRLLE